MIRPVRIGEHAVGPGNPCLVVAEAGVNHNGDFETALRLVDAAAAAGADAVKFQSFSAEDLVTASAGKASYQVETTGTGGGQLAMLKALELDPGEHARLKAHCEGAGLLYLCTPYDLRSIDRTDALDVAAFKIASTDTTNLPFLRYLARKGRPVILSTGMCTLGEVEMAVDTLRQGGLDRDIVLLQCTAEYPAPLADINLRAMRTMEQAFFCPVGFSDHTRGVVAATWAVALGACMVEKHFTLSRAMEGPDHRASLEPDELQRLVKMVREVEMALGSGRKEVMPSEAANKEKMQKSLVITRDIGAGEKITARDLACKRPGSGLPPSWFDRVVGRRIARDLAADSLLTMDAVQWES